MTAQNNQLLPGQTEAYADNGWNVGDIDATRVSVADDLVVQYVPNQADCENLTEFAQWVTEVRTAFPDLPSKTTSMITGDGQFANKPS